MPVHSLSIEVTLVGERWMAVAPWGEAEGDTFESAYWALMRLRP